MKLFNRREATKSVGNVECLSKPSDVSLMVLIVNDQSSFVIIGYVPSWKPLSIHIPKRCRSRRDLKIRGSVGVALEFLWPNSRGTPRRRQKRRKGIPFGTQPVK
jgi:hypothetical protein